SRLVKKVSLSIFRPRTACGRPGRIALPPPASSGGTRGAKCPLFSIAVCQLYQLMRRCGTILAMYRDRRSRSDVQAYALTLTRREVSEEGITEDPCDVVAERGAAAIRRAGHGAAGSGRLHAYGVALDRRDRPHDPRPRGRRAAGARCGSLRS